MTCTTCGNAHSDDCTPAALKARIDVESTMVVTLTGQVAAWEETAAQHARNEDYYRGLLDEVAGSLGVDAFIADDGSISESPLRAKVPELVRAMAASAAEATRLREIITSVAPCDACDGQGQTGDHYMITDADGEDQEIDEREPCATCLGTGLDGERVVAERNTLRAQLATSQTLAEDLRARLIPALDAAGVAYDAPVGALAKAIGNREQAAEVLAEEVNRLRGQLAEALATLANERGETVPGDAVTEGWTWDGVSWAIDTDDGVIDVERIMAGWRIMGCIEDHAVYALARDAIKAANAARKG